MVHFLVQRSASGAVHSLFCASDRTASVGVCRTHLRRDNKPFSVLDLGSRHYCPSRLSCCTVPLGRVSAAGYDD